ncbi:MAG: hypothetical protein M5U08_16600 [Burkholderiales bacterium]|nr:hypothetical protein [Burkholderiales bacterium]
MVAFNRADLQPRAHLRTLEMLRDHVEGLVPLLEHRLAKPAPPLAGPMRQIAHLIEKLFKELAAGYTRAVLSVPRSWLSLGYRAQLHTPLVRAMDYHARRLSLAHRLYARSPGAVWAELHRLFLLARGWRVAAERIESPRRSPLDVYRTALLLAFAQPSRLTCDEHERLQDYLARYADLAEIVPPATVTDPACVFAIDPHRDRPGVAYAKRHDAEFENGALLLKTARLVERIDVQLRRLRKGISAASLGLPDEASSLAYQEMLQRLRGHWRGDRAARSARTRFHPRVNAWVGLRDIWRALRAELPRDGVQEAGAGRAVDARDRVDRAERELARLRAAPHVRRGAAGRSGRARRDQAARPRFNLRVPGTLGAVEQSRASGGRAPATCAGRRPGGVQAL